MRASMKGGQRMKRGGSSNIKNTENTSGATNRNSMRKPPAIFGTVTAISGNMITVTRVAPPKRENEAPDNTSTPVATSSAPTTSTTFMIDATNAKVMKSGATATVASIVVGDTIMAEGTVSGSTVTATMIHDGPAPMMNKDSSRITGNGQPVILGTIASVTGASVVVSNKSGASYTVDASNSKVIQGDKTATVTDLKVGDMVLVQGTVNGTSIVASTILDNAPAPATGTGTQPKSKGFLGSVGGFFSGLFGFSN